MAPRDVAWWPRFRTPITFKEQSSPATPDAGEVAVYPKADGTLYSIDDTGYEVPVDAPVTRWFIDAFHFPNRNSNWANNFVTLLTAAQGRGLHYNTSPTQVGVVGEIGFTLWLPAGTYRVGVEVGAHNSFGNAEIFLNASSFGTIDCYSNQAAITTKTAIPAGNVVLTHPGSYELMIRSLGTKNASSTAYYVPFVGAILTKTA